MASRIKNTKEKRVRLFMMQRGACAICGSDLDLNATGAMAPTFDHIVPKSFGGANTIRNLRLAHSICNGQRGNNFQDVADLLPTPRPSQLPRKRHQIALVSHTVDLRFPVVGEARR